MRDGPELLKQRRSGAQLRNCPTGCTQRRAKRCRLTEKKTFDGRKCYSCGFFAIADRDFKPHFKRFKISDIVYSIAVAVTFCAPFPVLL